MTKYEEDNPNVFIGYKIFGDDGFLGSPIIAINGDSVVVVGIHSFSDNKTAFLDDKYNLFFFEGQYSMGIRSKRIIEVGPGGLFLLYGTERPQIKSFDFCFENFFNKIDKALKFIKAINDIKAKAALAAAANGEDEVVNDDKMDE